MFAIFYKLAHLLFAGDGKEANQFMCLTNDFVFVCLFVYFPTNVIIIVFGPVLLLFFKTLLSHCALINNFDHFGKVHYTSM